MTLKTILRFLLGDAEAIRRIASAKESIWIGMILVLFAGVARQYDQSFILESPTRWFLGSITFSAVTGTILYCLAVKVFEHGLPPDARSAWVAFMGCYWMTAPLAYFYAIPAERFLSSMGAVLANLILFGVVALWRVILMGRVISVVTGIGFLRATLRVGIVAAMEFLVIGFIASVPGAIARGMMGMENSPEEKLVNQVTGATITVAFWSIPALAIALRLIRSAKEVISGFPKRERAGFAWGALALVGLFFGAISVYPQIEQFHSATVQAIFDADRTRDALDYIATRGLKAFAASRPLPPKLFQHRMYREMQSVFSNLKASDPEWLRDFYLHRARVLISIKPRVFFPESADFLSKTIDSIEKLPGGKQWLIANRDVIEEHASSIRSDDSGPKQDLKKTLLEAISITNKLELPH